MNKLPPLFAFAFFVSTAFSKPESPIPTINDRDYFETHGLNVMFFDDYYPESHQGGISIIHHGVRAATNGDLRINIDPGQWQPIPKKGDRSIDKDNNSMSVSLSFPDESKDRQGFNPLFYPDLKIDYNVNIKGIPNGVEVTVDLKEPVPQNWVGKVGFNIELFPGLFFGKSYMMDNQTGYFPRQPNGPFFVDAEGEIQIKPMATGNSLILAPETDLQRMRIESDATLELLDGRGNHNNGWFVIRSPIPEGKTQNAITWKITTSIEAEWQQKPTIQVSQIGYHPKQAKQAFLELPKGENIDSKIELLRFSEDGEWEQIQIKAPEPWGEFLRFSYVVFDFSEIKNEGLYQIKYGSQRSHAFRIDENLYSRGVWQPTVEYFLPVQMCHMRVNEKYRIWHDTCHLDDALMAPTSINHFDGYLQGPETLTKYEPLEAVPGLNVGGWHDAGDYDLRVESQIGTVHTLALAYEHFKPKLDQTLINQEERWVEIHHPDGENDFLQQIEHGLISVIGGYKNLGRLYRGIITPTLRQYVMLGDAASMSDGVPYQKQQGEEKTNDGVWYEEISNQHSKYYDPHRLPLDEKRVYPELDDRLVFTEENPRRTLQVIAGLACASRVIEDYNQELADDALNIAKELWSTYKTSTGNEAGKTLAAVELYLTTKESQYIEFLTDNQNAVLQNFSKTAHAIGRILPDLNNPEFVKGLNEKAKAYQQEIQQRQAETPYGVPYRPNIWGDGWSIQRFGMNQYFLHKSWPEYFPAENLLKALNFVLGCHPGSNTASFASGVGTHSVLSAYGVNRADHSFIPGGVVSGTALIRPDFPELLHWPYLWQQTEYVMGGGATNFMFLAMAANEILNKE